MEQLNPGKIKKNIKQLKQRQEQYLYYLGQLAFQAAEEGKLEDAGMLEAHRTLKDIQTQLAQSEASLEQIKAAKEAAQKPRCVQCGEPLPKGAVFCARCGASTAAPPSAAAQAVVAAAPSAGGRLCPSCGAPLDEDAVFCGNCGAKSGPEIAAAAPPPAAAGGEPMPAVEETHACPKCGAVASEPGILFCSACGTNLAEEAAETEPAGTESPVQEQEAAAPAPAVEETMPAVEETIACPKCGTAISETDILFCSVCGTKVRE